MVDITIYIEGFGYEKDLNLDSTFDSSVFFREAFNRLFYQKIQESEFNIKIQPIGSVTQASTYLKRIKENDENAILLIDLETSKEKKQEKIERLFKAYDINDLFFMIQEMESWILSQPHILQIFGENENLILKQDISNISDNILLKNKHPEEIHKPSEKLETLFKQYFSAELYRRGRIKKSNRNYSKTKDAPQLIQLLDLEKIENTFEDAKNLIIRIQKH